jgi:hypothetical protein
MFDGSNGLAIRVRVLLDGAVPHELLVSVRMRSFGQPSELICSHCSCEAKLLGQPALPLTLNTLALFPIILLGCCELRDTSGPALHSGALK